ncbi:uncharacterized protein LOC126890215 [Diabrotica virgifera virgifera]|uniref:CCHC-type domain-containing protein n=1 Tax=Diabrotica virgifera virgifera TaxID=50390 RepID=A0ABM5KXV5_DIAVI|nr:uncharacterized protein LOC126890215 [Diabrotica virgifera virgifera]
MVLKVLKVLKADRNNELIEKASKLIDLLESSNSSSLSKADGKSWADIVKIKKTEPLIIKPKNQNQNSSVTKSVLTQKLCPADMAVSLAEVKEGANGRVMIHCQDKKSLENLKSNVERHLGAEYEIKVGKLNNPKIKIIDVNPDDLNDNGEFINKFLNQNLPDDSIQTDIKIIHKFKSNRSRGNNVNVIIELSPKQFNYLISNKHKVHMGWNSYQFFEFLSIIRCFRCWKFGHFSDKCESKNYVCPLCGGKHKKDQCNNTTNFKCSNCTYAKDIMKLNDIDVNHHVFDINCSCYLKQLTKSKEKVNYQF